MNREENGTREEDTLAELRRDEKVGATVARLLAAHKGDARELARALAFVLHARLLQHAERMVAVAALADLADAHALSGYLRALWELERHAPESVPLLYEMIVCRSHARVG